VGILVFTLTLTLPRSPYPSGSKSSLDACPPFHPRGRGKEEIYPRCMQKKGEGNKKIDARDCGVKRLHRLKATGFGLTGF